jgi:hypothetical protein
MREFFATLAVFAGIAVAAKIFDKTIRHAAKSLVNSRFASKIVVKHYIKKADKLYPGQKRGAEKKAWVKQQSERWQIETCKDADDIIDSIVRFMNSKSGSVKGQLNDKASAAVDELMDKITEDNDVK